MAFKANPELLQKIPGGSGTQSGTPNDYMSSAQAALGKWDRTPEAPGTTVGGALGAGMGGALATAGAGAALGAAGMGTASSVLGGAIPGFLASGPGMLVGAGIGILSYLFS
jgi:hypothetical protein